MYAKDLEEPKYQLFIKKCENEEIKNLNDRNAFIVYSNTIDDVYNNIDNYNSKRKRKVLIVFDDMIADIMTNKRFQAIIKELFIRSRKLIKMTLTEQVKILDDKIRANKAQYNLDRKAAKISALLSSKDLEKYEYLTGEDLGYEPDLIQRAKFEYSPLGEAFNKVFKKDDKNKKSLNTTMIWFITLCITLLNIVCLVLMKYHQLTLNLIQ